MAKSSLSFDLAHTGPRRTLSKQAIRLSLYAQLALVDMLALASAFLLSERICGHSWVSPRGTSIGFLFVPVYLFFALNQRGYSLSALGNPGKSLRAALTAFGIATVFVLITGAVMVTLPDTPPVWVGVYLASAAIFLMGGRLLFHRFAARQHAGHLIDEVVIVDDTSFVPSLPGKALPVINAQQAHVEPDLHNPVMINRLAECLNGVDRVVVACPPERQQAWSLLLKGSNIRGEIVLQRANTIGAIGLGRFGDDETLIVSRGPLSMLSRAQKRALDLAVTVPLLVLLTPLLVAVALAVKLESKGPVFFKQNRIGRSNSVFSILKFRSMRTDMCDAAGNRSASRDDDRITRVGAFIRRTSIDELPQLINVLRGDMSLVGPRPHALGSLAGDKLFWEVDEQYWVRHALKPGITGLAQIRGYRGATHQRIDLENRLRADLEYVNGWSLWLDIVILFATAKVVRHQNAF